MDDAEKDLVRARTDIIELVSQYTSLQGSGTRRKGVCPFHQENTPSFHVNAERGSWYCFGACSEGGDIFKFLMKAEGLTFREALERLAERAGVTLTHRGVAPEEAQRQRDERTRLLEANVEAQRFFRLSFGRAPIAQQYVRKRGLAHETLENFGIGYSPNDWDALADHLRAQRLNLADVEKAGLLRARDRGDGWYHPFRGRLTFPIVDVQERVVGFGARILENVDNVAKYVNSPETPLFSKSRILYGLNRARRAIQADGRVLVSEGYMDTVAAHQAGFENVVATLGTALTDEHVRLLGRYTKKVLLSFDADNAGIRAALRAAELFAAAGSEFELRVLALPEGDDPDSLLARGDAAGFRRAMDEAVTVPEFRLETLKRSFDLRTEGGRLDYLKETIPILSEIVSPLEQDRLVRRLAPYHPSFASGGTRAEDAIRLEIQGQRHSRRGLGTAAPAYGDPTLPTGNQRRPYSNNGERRSNYGNGSGNGPGRGNFRRDADTRPRLSEPEFTRNAPVARRAGRERAERVLLRAILQDEWVSTTLPRINGERGVDLFDIPLHKQLFTHLAPLLDGRIKPSTAIDALDDRLLANAATGLLMGDEEDEPLTEELIEGCIERLIQARLRDEERRIYLQGAQTGDALTEEQMRQWQRIAEARKRRHDEAPG